MVLSLRTTPNGVEDSTDRIEPETGDYIPDFAAREVLITELDQIRRSRIPVRYFTPIATAILMIAPLEILQDLLQSCKEAPDVFFDGVMVRLNRDGLAAIQSYALGNRMVTFPSIFEDNPTPCILTGRARYVSTMRLFPRMENGQQEIHRLQSILEAFWGEKAASWIATFTNPDFVESPQNHISLSSTFHGLGHDTRFAFKPLRSADPNEMRLQLHWLKPSPFRFFNSYSYENPIQYAGLNAENTKTWGDRFADEEEFKTGHVFTIRAENPADLPDWDMLELQWDLLRVAAIAGARSSALDDGTDWHDWSNEDDGDDEDVEPFQLDQEQRISGDDDS